jgi:hypothetical protein
MKYCVFAKHIILNSLFVFCFCAFLNAQETIEVSLNKNRAYVGDVINFTVKVQLPPNAQITAKQNFHFNDFDIISSDVKHLPSIENTYELDFNIAAYKTGSFTINPLTVFYINPDGTSNLFLTPEKHVEIISVADNAQVQGIKDIKALKKFKIKSLHVALILFVLLLFIVYAAFTVKSFVEYIKKSKQVEIDPKTKALNALEDLYKTRSDISARNFYYTMSRILRSYVSKKCNFEAIEMTTSEFFDKIKPIMPKEININEFKDYLKVFNLARYADFTPDETKRENNYNFTKKLLELL